MFIWIHGGANYLESSRLPDYHGDELAGKGDIVVASLNYRLGLFGFLDVSVLGGETYAGEAAVKGAITKSWTREVSASSPLARAPARALFILQLVPI
ncbi:hypothetical protein D3227_06365 [Mesorhizobium waimense]|uniref:Carboxylesterase type B domain-containing protein n=1 Tax=Mesorhizobium waimense TaxID=1300307 RepID=A0A3A5L5Q1_9HYPH|nr:hypothetical protein D3227_06365 [Mesorhizobium waimense]